MRLSNILALDDCGKGVCQFAERDPLQLICVHTGDVPVANGIFRDENIPSPLCTLAGRRRDTDMGLSTSR